MTHTVQEYDVQPDGTVTGVRWSEPHESILSDAAADAHRASLRQRRRGQALQVLPDGLEFNTYRAGYWAILEREDPDGMAELQAMRTRITFRRC